MYLFYFSHSRPLWCSEARVVEPPRLHSYTGEGPQLTPSPNRPIFSQSLGIFKSLCHHFGITKLHWIPPNNFLLQMLLWEGQWHVPFACCTFLLVPSNFSLKQASSQKRTHKTTTIDENARSTNTTMLANEPLKKKIEKTDWFVFL